MKPLIVLLLFLLPAQIQQSDSFLQNEFIVWNVGQGLWTTWIHQNECWHFDMGGEYRRIIPKVSLTCISRLNRIFLSHWDLDHVNFLSEVRKKNWNLCLAQEPGGTPSENRLMLTKGLTNCAKSPTIHNLWNVAAGDPQLKFHLKKRSNNHDSHVFELVGPNILVPGDSTTDEEKIWNRRLHLQIKGLVLGHHGSHTSTSDDLLQKLPDVRWAVASARYRRYGHPHKLVVERLAKRKIPLLRTEDWGTLHFKQ